MLRFKLTYLALMPSADSVALSSEPVCGRLWSAWNLLTALRVAGPMWPSPLPTL